MTCGWITEGFCILPSININWMTTRVKTGEYKRIYDLQIAWLFWYASTDNISKKLKEQGY